jgi:hypothetical protein
LKRDSIFSAIKVRRSIVEGSASKCTDRSIAVVPSDIYKDWMTVKPRSADLAASNDVPDADPTKRPDPLASSSAAAEALRQSLAFLSHRAKTQAITYALEDVIEDALREDFGAQSEHIIGLWQRLGPAQSEVFDMIDSRGGIFYSWTKAQRKSGFAQLPSSFDTMYDSFYSMRLNSGEKNLVTPAEFAAWENEGSPDPQW